MIHILKLTTSLALSASLMITATHVPHVPVNKVTLELNGAVGTYLTEQESVGAFLRERGITIRKADKVNVALSEPLEKTDTVIVEKARTVTVRVDGAEHRYTAMDETVGQVLEQLNITLGDHDRINASLTEPVANKMALNIQRVEIRRESHVMTIEHHQEEIKTSSLLRGTKKVRSAGADGERIVVTEKIFVDGELENEKLVSSDVSEEPQTRVTLVGTKQPVVKKVQAEVKKPAPVKKAAPASKTTVKKTTAAASDDSKNWKSFTLSFYTDLPSENGGYTVTATGEKLRSGMVASNYYSLGTKIYLSGWGTMTVKDRGGSNFNSSKRLDVFIPRKSGESNTTYLRRVNKLGLKTVKGYVK